MPIDSATLQTLLPPSFYQNGQLTVSDTEAQTVAAGIQARIADMPPAQKEAFLALMQLSTKLAPINGDPPADIETTLDGLESLAGKVAQLLQSSSSIEFLTRAMIEQAGEQRKEALEGRLNARETARGELMAQAGQMKEAAEKMMAGAITALVLTVVMSAVSLVAAGMSSFQASKNLAAMKNDANNMTKIDGIKQDALGKLDKNDAHYDKDLDSLNKEFDLQGLNSSFTTSQSNMNLFQSKLQQATNIGTIGQTVNQLGQGAANAASSITQAQSKELDALGSISAANAQYEEGQADMKKEMQQALDDMVKQIINFLKELQEAKANHMQALTKV
ncbi:hypothetical protein G3545_18955 [Starkeya sp. ORNL1]|uniref:type III secretion system translocon subunit SctB n=1 Tax=Starkeya sp. ORNL1 TaxID=2709380 RepID=UPI001462BF6D|nr:type III secretion system translocon subunit SctB [Starkeya sp. ORNL1]QJP15551.1 hypothetical protein G3545_18955 [Starkeya sp. ORNL1]